MRIVKLIVTRHGFIRADGRCLLGRAGELSASRVLADVSEWAEAGVDTYSVAVEDAAGAAWIAEAGLTPAEGIVAFDVPDALLRSAGSARLEIRAEAAGVLVKSASIALPVPETLTAGAPPEGAEPAWIDRLAQAAAGAREAAERLTTLEVSAGTLEPDQPAAVMRTETQTGIKLHFGIPRGAAGGTIAAAAQLPTADGLSVQAKLDDHAAQLAAKENRAFENLMGRPDRLPDKAFNVTFSLSGGVYAVTNTGGHAYDGLIVCPKIGNRSVLVMCKAKLDSDIADQEFQAVGYAYGLVEPNRPIAPAAFDGRISRSGWRQFRLVAPVLGAYLPNGGHVDLRFMVPYAGGANYSVKDIVVCDVETGFTLSDLEKYGFSEAAHFWDRFPAPDCRQLTQRYVVGSVAAERAAIGSEIALAKAQAVLESAGAPYRRMAASPEARTFASPGWYLGTGVSGIESGKKYLFTLRVVGEAYNDFSTLAEIRGGAWYYTSRVRVVKAVDAATQTGVLAGVFTGDALGAINIYGQANNQAHTGQSALAFGFYEITDAGFESAANIALLASRMLAGKGISDYLFKPQWDDSDAGIIKTRWKGKKALCLGDSLTAAGVWQQQLTAMLGMTVATRALGGIGLVGMVDGAAGLAALTSADVTGQDLIVLFGGYNNRSSPKGAVTDMYPAQNTYAGMVNYAIQRIFALLAEAGNAGCQVLIVTPHCPGKYGYIDADGYAEYPPGSGQSLMDLCDIMAEAANRNNLRCLNLWRVSGINRWNWAIYAASPTPTNADGSGSGPYPYNNDQLHLNAAAGYPHLGAVIARYVATF